MFYKFHNKSPWLKKVLIPFWCFQIGLMLALISVLVWLDTYSIPVTNVVLLIVSAACTIVSFTEIVLFAATRLHPLTYLTLQLAKTTIWFVLFVLSAVNTTRVQIEMQGQEEQGYNFGSSEGYFYLLWFAEPLVLFVTFLGTLIYASVIYHRHRRAKSRFLRSFQGKDLFPVIADEAADPVGTQRISLAPPNSVRETAAEAEPPLAPETKEALEVTVLRELGGTWEVHELPATRSGRSSRGCSKSARSLKGIR